MGARHGRSLALGLGLLAALSAGAATGQPDATRPPATPLGATLAGPIHSAHPTQLWGGVATGMSLAQVRALYPLARLATGPTADTGYLRTLSSPAPPVADHPAVALFRFHNDRLFGVRLNVEGLPSAQDRQNRALVGRLVQAYSARDAAYDCADNSRADVNLIDCKWLDAGVSIRLEYMDVAGQAPYLKILYSSVADVGSDL